MTLSKLRVVPVFTLVLASMVSGCGSDASGPSGEVDSNGALQSLLIGLQGVAIGSPTTPEGNDATFGGLASQLDRVTVTLDGTPQGMFALGLRESFPPGTCEEDLFVTSFPSPPGACTLPSQQTVVILWQAHSAKQPPDRLILIVADTGTSNFDFESTPIDALPAIALYLDGPSTTWGSLSGTLTSQTTATNQTCSLTLPPYAKSGTCSIATFSEQGSIVFEPFSINIPSTQRRTLVIPSVSLHGLWIAVTEIQPLFTGNRLIPVQAMGPRALAQAVAARLPAPPTPAR